MAAASGNQGINNQDPESVVEFAAKICHDDADALLCSCTAWRSLEAVDQLEQLTGKPVVSSNQASIWATYKNLNITEPVAGFGSLLESLSTVTA